MSTPIPLQVTRHQCPHCRRTWAKRTAAEAHIARCWHNSEARGCKTCVHFEPAHEGPCPEDPGWPEACGAGQSLADGLRTACPRHQLEGAA